MTIESIIKSSASDAGFALCGIAPAEILAEPSERFSEWLLQGMNGSIAYLENYREQCCNIRIQFPQSQSVIVCAMPYSIDYESSNEDREIEGRLGIISHYATRDDYHKTVLTKLSTIESAIKDKFPSAFTKSYVDTGHLMEKAFAERAGIGWQGRNTLIINPKFGSFMFLGEIITDLHLEPDSPIESHCGTCKLCVEKCPTQALTGKCLDARRCITFWTGENRGDGEFPQFVLDNLGDRLFSCDECQTVCPWNSIENTSREPRLPFRPGLRKIPLDEIESMTQEAFKAKFKNTPVERLKLKGLKRNRENLLRH
jgi:epoxyqueuosine reductase